MIALDDAWSAWWFETVRWEGTLNQRSWKAFFITVNIVGVGVILFTAEKLFRVFYGYTDVMRNDSEIMFKF